MLFAMAAMLSLGYIKIFESALPAFVVISIFFICNIIPLLYVSDADTSYKFILITVYLIMTFFFYQCLVLRAESNIITLLLKGYIYTCAFGCIVSIFCILIPNPLSDLVLYGRTTDEIRTRAFFQDPNVFGPFLVPAFILCAYCWRSLFASRIFTAVRWFFLLTFLVCIILAASRGGWLNLLVALAALGWIAQRQASWSLRFRRRSSLPIVALAIVAGLSYGLVALGGYDEFLADRLEEKAYDQDRFLAQMLALEEAVANPFGIGPGQSESYEGSVSLFRAPYSPHSLYVRVLAESGWGGAASFLVFLLLTMRRAWSIAVTDWRYASLSAVVFASLLGILANSFFVDTLHWRHFWMLLGTAWGLSGLWRWEFAVRARPSGIRAK